MIDKYFSIYAFANSLPGKLFRFVPISAILVLFLILKNNTQFTIQILASFSLFIINELFLAMKVSNLQPKYKVFKNETRADESMIFSARLAFNNAQDSYSLIKKLLSKDEVKFFLSKMGGGEIKKAEVSKEELLAQAKEFTVYVRGTYITEVDLLASYILLSEATTKLLSEKELVNEDVVNIAFWTRKKFRPDSFERSRIKFIGEGVFDSLVYGWNYEVKKYTRDLTSDVLSSHFPPIITGHEKDFDQLLISLSKGSTPNAIIIGEPGTGKTSLVNYFAYKSFLGTVPEGLTHKKIYELLLDRFLSGVSNTGELETRLSALLSELSNSPNTIILIQNIENIFGGGGFDFDISGALYDYIKNEKIQIIGTTTIGAFSSYLDNKESVRDLFGVVRTSEFDEAKSLLLLCDAAEQLEKKNNIKILYSALKQCVLLSSVYFPQKFLPGRAFALTEEVISAAKIQKRKIVSAKDVIELVQAKTHVALSSPDKKEKELLLTLEEKMHKRIIGQEQAVAAVAEAMRRVRSGFEEKARPISVFLFLGPTGVGKTETAKALASEYFGDENAMIRLDMSEFQTQDQLTRILGEKSGEEYIANSLTEQVVQKPFSLILLDEFEKAHPNILDLFLQVFDEGRLTTNQGKTISFKNNIIIATSNAGSELIREKQDITKNDLIDALLRNNTFKIELINRFDEVVLFKYLSEDEISKITALLLNESFKKLEDDQIKVQFDDSVIQKIVKEAFDPEFGARNIRRFIEENVESFISKLILEDTIKKGAKVLLSVDDSNDFVVR